MTRKFKEDELAEMDMKDFVASSSEEEEEEEEEIEKNNGNTTKKIGWFFLFVCSALKVFFAFKAVKFRAFYI